MTVRCLSSSLEPRKKKISNTGKQCNHVLIPERFKEIVTKRWTPEDVLKQTRTKNEEYRVKLGRLRRGRRGCLYSIVALTHSLTQQDNIMASPPYEVVATKIGHNYTLV